MTLDGHFSNLSDILRQAEEIALSSPDEAARFLAPYRKMACESLRDSPSALPALADIAIAQTDCLLKSGAPDKALGIAQWFLHTLHHFEESVTQAEYAWIRRGLREPFSRFFRIYARVLRALDRIEDMRIAMRNAMDLTRELPMAVVSMLHLYEPLLDRMTLEDEPTKDWILKRCAEALANLDFCGLHDSPCRKVLDLGQYILRNPDARDESVCQIDAICRQNLDDIALNTLATLFKHAYLPSLGGPV